MAARKTSKRKYGPSASKKVEAAMREMKEGKLRSGSSGRKVTNPKQAIAIGLSEARSAGGKVPKSKKKAAAKKAAPKKSTAKKSTAKRKAAPKKSTAKRKAAPKKSTAKKSTAKKSTTKKSTAKKSTAKKSTTKRAAAPKRSTATTAARADLATPQEPAEVSPTPGLWERTTQRVHDGVQAIAEALHTGLVAHD